MLSGCSATAPGAKLEDEFTSLMLLVDVTTVATCRAEGHGLRNSLPVDLQLGQDFRRWLSTDDGQ